MSSSVIDGTGAVARLYPKDSEAEADLPSTSRLLIALFTLRVIPDESRSKNSVGQDTLALEQGRSVYVPVQVERNLFLR
jgi:hypothetical protein